MLSCKNKTECEFFEKKNSTYVFIKIKVKHKEHAQTHKYLVDNMKRNNWLLDQYVSFRPWDYGYNLELFTNSLRCSGRAIIDEGHSTQSTNIGRRMIFSAHLLEQAYNTDDKSRDKWYDQYKMTFDKEVNGLSRCHLTYTGSVPDGWDRVDYQRKMSDFLRTKGDKKMIDKQEYAWNYIKKWFHYFWD